MRETINEAVGVVLYYNAHRRTVLPYAINWRNREYHVGKIGYHHTIYNGKILHHIFELVDKQETMWFRINLNTQNLHWILEAVHDNNP